MCYEFVCMPERKLIVMMKRLYNSGNCNNYSSNLSKSVNLNDQYAPCLWLFWIVVMALVAISSRIIIQKLNSFSKLPNFEVFHTWYILKWSISVKINRKIFDLATWTFSLIERICFRLEFLTYQEHSSLSTDLEMMKDRNECFRIITEPYPNHWAKSNSYACEFALILKSTILLVFCVLVTFVLTPVVNDKSVWVESIWEGLKCHRGD